MRYLHRKISFFFAVLLLAAFWGACGGGGTPTPTGPTVTATTLDKVLTTGGFTLTFSTDMDKTSVETAFSVTGSGPVPGTITWGDNKTVTFEPTALWKTHHPYTLTIGTGAMDATGNAMTEAYTATFRPELNMHDVNGDGIDDFMLGASAVSGAVYLFLGRAEWTDIDLASTSASATYTVQGGSSGFGVVQQVVGDIDGDGFADMVMTGPDFGSNHEGVAVVIYGSSAPASIEFSPTLPEGTAALQGTVADSYIGVNIAPLGDINGDGLADFLIGGLFAPADQRQWIVLGSSTRMTNAIVSIDTVTTFTITTPNMLPGRMYWTAGCDVNGDELDDIIVGSPAAAGGGTERGQIFMVKGSASPASIDLRTTPADQTINGPIDNGDMGTHFGCGDINSDGYQDLLIGVFRFDTLRGEVFLIPGSAAPAATINLADGAPSALFSGAASTDAFGSAACSPGDVNNDGFDDIVAGAFAKNTYQGAAYLFLGSASPASVDLKAGGSASANYVGKPTSMLGQCTPIGDVNGDGIDDIILGANNAAGSGTARGQAYLVYGNATPTSLDLNTQNPNATITGKVDNDHLSMYFGY